MSESVVTQTNKWQRNSSLIEYVGYNLPTVQTGGM
jgi:hypothetical protein